MSQFGPEVFRKYADILNRLNEDFDQKETANILTEARSAPLYHFTSESGLFKILNTDTLFSPAGKIYFTRDIDRQFVPHPKELLSDISWGLRVDQAKLYQHFGKRLQAGGQPTEWTKEKSDAWMADPKNAREIEHVKKHGYGTGSAYDGGALPQDIIRGTIPQRKRWESEEHLYAQKVENLHEYLTGLVVGSGMARWARGRSRDALGELVNIFINRYRKKENWAARDTLLNYTKKFNIPFVFKRAEIGSDELKQAIFATLNQRKAEREKEANLPQLRFSIYKNPEKGGFTIRASSLSKAAERIKDEIEMVYGYKNWETGEEQIFDQPVPVETLINKTSAQ